MELRYRSCPKTVCSLPALAEVHPRFRTPAIAIIALGIWSAFLACLGRFQELINYAMFVAWIFYGLAAAAIFSSELERPYRVPRYSLDAAPVRAGGRTARRQRGILCRQKCIDRTDHSWAGPAGIFSVAEAEGPIANDDTDFR